MVNEYIVKEYCSTKEYKDGPHNPLKADPEILHQNAIKIISIHYRLHSSVSVATLLLVPNDAASCWELLCALRINVLLVAGHDITIAFPWRNAAGLLEAPICGMAAGCNLFSSRPLYSFKFLTTLSHSYSVIHSFSR